MLYGAQAHANAAGVKSDRPMNRIEANLEDLNRASESLDRSLARLMQHAVALGYYTPDPTPPTTAIDGRAVNLHEAVKKIDRQVDMLASALAVFD